MKKAIKLSLSLLTVLLCICILLSCAGQNTNEGGTPESEVPAITGSTENKENTATQTGLWKNALYLKDTTLGTGEKTVTVEVKADNQSIVFTIHTDKKTVGDALMEHSLITGEDGDYGLYIKTVNGILADYDADQTYWAFYIDGDFAMAGVDSTEITAGAAYTLERTK